MNNQLLSTIAAVIMLAAASFGRAGPGGGGHAAGMPAGAMGGGMRPTVTMGTGQMNRETAPSRESTAPAREMSARPDSPPAAHADPVNLLGQNSKLNWGLRKLLPADTTPQQACEGFSQLGGCVAAIHVASNLSIPFEELKARITGPAPVSLGSAIHALKPDANADRAERKAQRQARKDIGTVSE
jgi:hypothetical protein